MEETELGLLLLPVLASTIMRVPDCFWYEQVEEVRGSACSVHRYELVWQAVDER